MLPALRAEILAWLERADRDLLGAQAGLDAPIRLLEITAYHSQQAAEKALKAYLTAQQQAFAKTHDLVDLTQQCKTIEPDFGQFLGDAGILTPYVSQFRYPYGPIEPLESDARDALRRAQRIVEFVHHVLSL